MPSSWPARSHGEPPDELSTLLHPPRNRLDTPLTDEGETVSTRSKPLRRRAGRRIVKAGSTAVESAGVRRPMLAVLEQDGSVGARAPELRGVCPLDNGSWSSSA